MSGGHWNYVGYRLNDALSMIARDKTVIKRWPHIAVLFDTLGEILLTAEHEMDWALSENSNIENDKALQLQICNQVLEIAAKVTSEAIKV
ncbi:MAG: hypothetical protein ACRD5H_00785 [Nitrososphaerales archaeon]